MDTPQYITDGKGKKLFVLVPINQYKKLLEKLEEFEDICLYDKAMAENEPSIPVAEAFLQLRPNPKAF